MPIQLEGRAMVCKRVLIVDDDIKTVELVKLYLKRDGYNAITAYNVKEALHKARESQPNLIVLDLMLPEMDGLEICRTLRRIKHNYYQSVL